MKCWDIGWCHVMQKINSFKLILIGKYSSPNGSVGVKWNSEFCQGLLLILELAILYCIKSEIFN